MHYSLVQTTLSSKEEAKSLASLLLKEKLAACIQIQKVQSLYVWKEEVCDDKEYLLNIKTKKSLYQKLENFLLQHHPYETPEIIELDIIGGHKRYFQWIDESVTP